MASPQGKRDCDILKPPSLQRRDCREVEEVDRKSKPRYNGDEKDCPPTNRNCPCIY